MRKTLVLTIDDEGRDYGKRFLITEMPAQQAEKWAMRAILALMRGGMELPDGYEFNGMAALIGIALREVLPNLAWQDAEPLLDEMLACVEVMPDPTNSNIRRAIMGDVEEVKTLYKLRMAVWDIHTDFLLAGENPT